MLISSVLGILTAIFFLISHFVLLHCGFVHMQATVLAILFGLGTLLYSLIYCLGFLSSDLTLTTALGWVYFINGWILYVCFIVIYLGNFFYAIRKSVSIRIMIELKKAGQAGLTLAEFDQVYPIDAMVRGRLRALVSAGWLHQEGGFFSTTRKGARLARFLSFIRKTAKIGPDSNKT